MSNWHDKSYSIPKQKGKPDSNTGYKGGNRNLPFEHDWLDLSILNEIKPEKELNKKK